MKPQSVFAYFFSFLKTFGFVVGSVAFLYKIGEYPTQVFSEDLNKDVDIILFGSSLKLWLDYIYWGVTAFFSLDILMPWLVSRHKKDYLIEHYAPLIVVLLGMVTAITAGVAHYLQNLELRQEALGIISSYIFILLMLLTFVNFSRRFVSKIKSPAFTLIVSFVLIICLGALLLSMPASVKDNAAILNYQEAFFMSTSATCVTGLSVKSLGEFTPFGQGVILALIQIGGLGLLTFVAVFSLTQRRGLGLKERMVLSEALNFQQVGQIHRLVRYIFAITLITELIGAVFLYFQLPNHHWEHGVGQLGQLDRIYVSVFTSISAFCNAGFSLYSDSLMQFDQTSSVSMIVAVLIIVGGLGFAVILNLLDVRPTQSFWAQKFEWVRALTVAWEKRFGKREALRMTVQTKLMLSMTAVILFASFCMFYFLEFDNFNKSLSVGDSLAGCFFQAVSLRTAGFNTIDFASFGMATLLFSIAFMLVGGGPGGTAGGLKISTLAMMVFSVGATARGSEHVEIFKRRIPHSTLSKALVVVTVFFLGFLLISGLLFITESFAPETAVGLYSQSNPDGIPAMHLLFEAASAYATVGLSTGITQEISEWGKVVLIVAMIAGRIGPLTVILAMGRKKRKNFAYPEENVMIG